MQARNNMKLPFILKRAETTVPALKEQRSMAGTLVNLVTVPIYGRDPKLGASGMHAAPF